MFSSDPIYSTLFARKAADGFDHIGERHRVAGVASDDPIMRVRVTVDQQNGQPLPLNLISPSRPREDDSFIWTYTVSEWTPPDDTGKLPGDQVIGSLRWTIDPRALSTDRTTRLTAAWQKYATAETLWLLSAADDPYIRSTALHNKACPAELRDWAARFDRFNEQIETSEHAVARRAAENAEVLALIDHGEFAAAARHRNSPSWFLDECARGGDSDLQRLAAVHPSTPAGGLAAVVRADPLRVRSVLRSRFALIEENPRWDGFSRKAIVAAVEHYLDDEIAEALVQFTDDEIADNFGTWGPPGT